MDLIRKEAESVFYMGNHAADFTYLFYADRFLIIHY